VKALSPTIQEFDSIIRYDIKEAVKSGKATIRMKLLNKMISYKRICLHDVCMILYQKN
jgi:hypothetical protein